MSFSHIVLKMIKADYKKYTFYYLCNSFTVMFFFIFSTVFFNEQISQVRETESIKFVLTIPMIALIVFSLFFISYAHSIFIKQRRKEFALFMTLGMSNRDIAKLLLLENGMIALASLVTGIASGIILSRGFFALLMNFIGEQTVLYHLTTEMFVYSIALFLIIFLTAVGRSLYLILKRNIILSLKSDKVVQTSTFESPGIGALGLLFIGGSIIGLYYSYAKVDGAYLFLWVAATFFGLYLCISQFTPFFIKLSKRNKSYYYRRLLFLSNLNYKLRQLTSVFMLVTVMVMISILFSTIVWMIFQYNEKETIHDNVYDIAIMQAGKEGNISSLDLSSTIEQTNNPIQKHLSVSVYFYYPEETDSGFSDVISFMSLSDYNKLQTSSKQLNENEFIHLINNDLEDMNDENIQSMDFPIQHLKGNYSYKETVVERKVNYLYNFHEIFIIDDSRLDELKNNSSGLEASIDLFNVDDWKNTANTVEALKQELIVHLPNHLNTEEPFVDFPFDIVSKIEGFEMNKSSNGILLFITTILGVLFFFGSFILLYANLVSEIDREQEKFKKLHKIGMTSREVKKAISKDIATLFFLPTIVGTILSFLYMIAMVQDMGGIIHNPEVFLYFLSFAGGYHFIQIGFYLYARRKIPELILR